MVSKLGPSSGVADMEVMVSNACMGMPLVASLRPPIQSVCIPTHALNIWSFCLCYTILYTYSACRLFQRVPQGFVQLIPVFIHTFTLSFFHTFDLLGYPRFPILDPYASNTNVFSVSVRVSILGTIHILYVLRS